MPREEHNICCKMLDKIGNALNFDVKKPGRGHPLYHLANPDCVWYLKISDNELSDALKVQGKIPIVVFEVLYSEQEKSMRGSLGTFALYKAPLNVFVLLQQKGEDKKSFENRLDYLNRLINENTSIKCIVWTNEDVKRLHSNFVASQL